MNKFLAPVFVVIFLVGCASAQLIKQAETPEQKYWVSLQIFDTYDEAALSLAQDASTPVAVKQGLKTARSTANSARLLAIEAYKTVQEARAELDQKQDVTTLDKLNAALRAFNNRADVLFDKVDAFKSLVDDIQG